MTRQPTYLYRLAGLWIRFGFACSWVGSQQIDCLLRCASVVHVQVSTSFDHDSIIHVIVLREFVLSFITEGRARVGLFDFVCEILRLFSANAKCQMINGIRYSILI